MDIPNFSNISDLQDFLPVLLKCRFLVRMCITTSLDRRVLSRRDKRPESRPSQESVSACVLGSITSIA